MIARLEVTRGPLTEYPLAEKVRGGWQNGVTFYPDEDVTKITPLVVSSAPTDQDEREALRDALVAGERKSRSTGGSASGLYSAQADAILAAGFRRTPAEHPEPSSDDEDVRDLRELARRARDAQQRVAISPEAAERLADRLVAQSTAEAMLIKVEADAQESVKLYADQYYAAQEKLDRIEKRIGNLSRLNEYGAVPLRWLIRQVAAILNDKEEDRD